MHKEIAAGLSDMVELPTISNVPIKSILLAGLRSPTLSESIEDTFAVGTKTTTPALTQVHADWPRPRVFWRIFGGTLLGYFLLHLGWTQFHNTNFLPGIMVLGAFVVPLSIVVFFFEMNVPRNVSLYQVAKMLLVGGAISLIATMVLLELIPGSGTGDLIPGMLTGLIEESGKVVPLLLLVREARYRWQMNGLLLGAAVGAGFAGFETAGYALNFFLMGRSPEEQIALMFRVIKVRGILAPGGHVIWTAMIGAAIWRVKGDRPFAIGMLFRGFVVRRFLLAVVLHGLWDTHIGFLQFAILGFPIQLLLLSLVGWYVIFATLKQSLSEIEEAKLAELRNLDLTGPPAAASAPA